MTGLVSLTAQWDKNTLQHCQWSNINPITIITPIKCHNPVCSALHPNVRPFFSGKFATSALVVFTNDLKHRTSRKNSSSFFPQCRHHKVYHSDGTWLKSHPALCRQHEHMCICSFLETRRHAHANPYLSHTHPLLMFVQRRPDRCGDMLSVTHCRWHLATDTHMTPVVVSVLVIRQLMTKAIAEWSTEIIKR